LRRLRFGRIDFRLLGKKFCFSLAEHRGMIDCQRVVLTVRNEREYHPLLLPWIPASARMAAIFINTYLRDTR